MGQTQAENGLSFALPIIVEAGNEGGKSSPELQFNLDIPEEFFGLDGVMQLRVIDAVMTYLKKGMGGEFPENADQTNAAMSELYALGAFSIPIAARLVIQDQEFLEVSAQMPERWLNCSAISKNLTLAFCLKYLEGVGVTIFSREANAGGAKPVDASRAVH